MRSGGELPGWDLDALWREHGADVVSYARRRVSPAEVDEVVAETFVVAWRHLPDVPEQALPWLLGVARRVSANVRRAGDRRDALRDRLTAARPATVVAGPGEGSGELTDALRAALTRLREDDRELLLLLGWDGLSREDAARALRCSRGALAVRVHRARRRLRAELELGRPGDRPAEEPPGFAHPVPRHAALTRSPS